MIRPVFMAILSAMSISACASVSSAAPRGAGMLAARLLAGSTAVSAAAPRGAMRAEAKPLRARNGRLHPWPPGSPVPAASRAGVQEPGRDGAIDAVQVYPWAEGSIYPLYTEPLQVSDIALQPGEGLVSVASGDTARWVIGDTTSGAGATRRTHVLVKPSAAGLATNLVIATDRRVYHVELESSAKDPMASIAWSYPEDPLVALRGSPQAESAAAAGVAVEALDFDYRIEGDSPPWRPVRAFDDGHQVFIQFPPTFADGEAPPLFVTGEGGRVELVNYRVRGRYYVVDRLFAAAELRLGERHQQVVRIVRQESGRARRGS